MQCALTHKRIDKVGAGLPTRTNETKELQKRIPVAHANLRYSITKPNYSQPTHTENEPNHPRNRVHVTPLKLTTNTSTQANTHALTQQKNICKHTRKHPEPTHSRSSTDAEVTQSLRHSCASALVASLAALGASQPRPCAMLPPSLPSPIPSHPSMVPRLS